MVYDNSRKRCISENILEQKTRLIVVIRNGKLKEFQKKLIEKFFRILSSF